MRWGPEDWDAWALERGERDEGPFADEESLLDLLRALPGRRGMTVADLGCGSGRLLPFLAREFGKVVAVDYAPASLALARRCAVGQGVTFRRRDLRDLSPFRNAFDVAVAVGSIVGPRPEDLCRILSEVHRALVDGGLFAGVFPAAPKGRAMVPMRLVPDAKAPETLALHEVELQYRLRAAGFRGVRIQRFEGRSARAASLLAAAVRRADN